MMPATDCLCGPERGAESLRPGIVRPRGLPAAGCLALVILFLFPAFRAISARQATSENFRENFPHVVDEDWQAFAASLALDSDGSANAFVDRILASVINISPEAWRQGIAASEKEMELPQGSITIDWLKSSPETKTGRPFRVDGTILRVVRYRDAGTVGEDASGLRFLVDAGGGKSFWMIPFDVPRRLSAGSANVEAGGVVGQYVAGQGVFAGLADGVPVLVSQRLKWLPKTPESILGVNSGQVLLAGAGYDCGLFDTVRNFTTVAITEEEVQAFGQLIEAVETISRQPDRDELMKSATPFALEEVARHPAANAGQLLGVRGTLRRVTPVVITSPAMREALGKEVYYHLDLFVPLGNKRIRLGEGKDGNPVEFSGSYGITIIAGDLPDELLNFQEGKPRLLELNAFMFKVWMHSSLSTEKASSDLRRPNPVLVAVPGEIVVSAVAESRSGSRTDLLICTLLVFGLATVGLVWWKGRSQQKTVNREPLPEQPDFSGLEQNVAGRDAGETESSP